MKVVTRADLVSSVSDVLISEGKMGQLFSNLCENRASANCNEKEYQIHIICVLTSHIVEIAEI